MNKKDRLDKILFEKGYFDTKSKAQAAIMAGDVKINDETITKAGFQIEIKDNTKIEIKTMPFVSRGGFKLDKAIKTFNINLKDKTCLDAGASTGGFTDCMLQNGANKVYAVDVGYGQIAWKLRNDQRVKVVERVNVKNCVSSDIYSENDILPTFCAMDLSFISITKVLENILKLMSPYENQIMALIKPQFEAGKDQVGKNGVVREESTHIEVIKNVLDFAEKIGLKAINLDFSPIKGPAGNIEYIVLFTTKISLTNDIDIASIVKSSHLLAE
ncbi:MAG: TlyA family RNA methyltransferase [Candidatus Gastranaerophilales bacterium]|nr:TlyA family RNA methyltransferase [Candidatus Gastranaerophilales bacterium]